MYPISRESGPADRNSGDKADRSTQKITDCQQTGGGKDAFGETCPVLEHNFDNGLGWRKERQRQEPVLRRDQLPNGKEQRERYHPWRERLQTSPTGISGFDDNRCCDQDSQGPKNGGEVVSVSPVALGPIRPKSREQGSSKPGARREKPAEQRTRSKAPKSS